MSKKEEFGRDLKQFMPQQLKTKRRLFNNKRYHTQPNDYSPSKFCLFLPFGANQNYSPNLTRKGRYGKVNQCEFFKKPTSLISNKTKSKTKQNYWDGHTSMRNLKSCKVVHEGYCKRKIRMKDTQLLMDSFFINSSRLTSSKENLHTNICYINKVLHNSFPKLDLLLPRNDHILKFKKEQDFASLNRKRMVQK